MYTYYNSKSKPLFDNIHEYLKWAWISQNSKLIILSDTINWNNMCEKISKAYSHDNWRPSKNLRLMLWLLILSQITWLSDRKLVHEVKTNIEYKYFCWARSVHENMTVSPTTITHFRNKLSEKKEILEEIQNIHLKEEIRKLPKKVQRQYDQDSTVVEEKIKYPNDLNLLNDMVQKWAKLIKKSKQVCWITWKKLSVKWKRIAEKLVTKYFYTRKKTKEYIASTKEKLIEIWINTIKTIEAMLRSLARTKSKASRNMKVKMIEYLDICNKVVEQQKEMAEKWVKYVKNRIVSLHKPYIRPISKWKAGKKVEFWGKWQIWVIGWKLAVAVSLEYDNKHDSKWVKEWIEKFEQIRWKPPSEVWYDKWWRSQENYDMLEEKGIRNWIQGSNWWKKLDSKTQKRLYKRRSFSENIINDVKNHRNVNKTRLKKENVYLSLVMWCMASNMIRMS